MLANNQILKLDIVKHDKIWGNEQWIISAHANGITTEKTTKIGLDELYLKNPSLFGKSNLEQFPLLVKIIEADDHLSVQVHPDDEYAQQNENSLGKNECWYVLDCKQSADIVIGHNVKDGNELKTLIENNQLEQKLNILPIKKGDFFNIPAGTVHAIRGGTTILEVQQSSDITYRLYDYGRLENGMPRELHIEKSIDVIDWNDYVQKGPKTVQNENYNSTVLTDNPNFTVELIDVKTELRYEHNYDFVIAVALNDTTCVDGELIANRQGFIIPNGHAPKLSANSKIYIAYIK